MPQTMESINHAKAAEVPIIVALNKVDKPEATDTNIQRILGQFAEHELNPVDWGGYDGSHPHQRHHRTTACRIFWTCLTTRLSFSGSPADFGGRRRGNSSWRRSLEEGRGAGGSTSSCNKAQAFQGSDCHRRWGVPTDGFVTSFDDRGQRIKRGRTVDHPHRLLAASTRVPDAGDKFYVVKSLKEAEAAAQDRKRPSGARTRPRQRRRSRSTTSSSSSPEQASQGAAAHRQGGRAGLARDAARRSGRSGPTRSSVVGQALRSRRRQRIGHRRSPRPAGAIIARLQRHRRPGKARKAAEAEGRGHPVLRRHLRHHRRCDAGLPKACLIPNSSSRSSVTLRFATCSRSPRSAWSPAATSRTA